MFGKKSGKDLITSFISTSFVAGAGLCSGVILARTLPPVLRGEFAAVLLWPSILGLLGDLGLGFAFSYYVVKDKEHVDGLWTLAVTVGLLWGGFLSCIGCLLIPHFVQVSGTALFYLKLNLITVPMSMLTGYCLYFLLGSQYVSEFNGVRFLNTAVYTAGIALVALLALASVANYTLVYIAAQLVSCAAAIILMWTRLKPKFRWEPKIVRLVFAYGGKTYLSSLAAQMNLRLDQLLMSSLMPATELGLYVVAVSFSSVLMPLFNALAIVVIPKVNQVEGRQAGGRVLVQSFRLGIVLSLIPIVVGIFSAQWLITTVFGAQYAGSVTLGQILLIAVALQGTNIVLGNGLRGLGHPGKPAIAEGIGLVVTVVLLWCLLPVMGAQGAAIASLCAYATVTLMQLFYVGKASRLGWRDILPISHGFLMYGDYSIKQSLIRFHSALYRRASK